MPAAQWTTKEQYEWLQEQLPEHIALHSEDKDYTHFWAKTHLYWFKRWPEQATLFPDIPLEITLTEEQQAAELAAKKTCKVRLWTWFRWWTNASKKNHGLKKEISDFETTLLLKSRTKSVEDIYMDMVYDEQIKPLVKVEQEVGNIATAGCCMVLGRKFCKELLEDESDEVKKEVREKYNKQKKVKKDMLDDKADNNDKTDTDAIVKGIDDLPIICQCFAHLIKKKTRFIVSFTCAGLDPRQNWDIVTLLCHPSETPAGSNFSQLCPDKDNTFLAAYQQYAESIFPPNKRNPLLPDVGDDNETKELEGCNNGEEPKDAEEHAEDGEENNKGQHGNSIDWDNLGLYFILQPPDANYDASPLSELNQSTFYSETQAQFNASVRQTQPDASFGQAQPDASLKHAWHNTATMPPNPISMLQSSVPGTIEALGLSSSHANLMAIGYFGSDNTTQNSFPPAFSSSVPSFTDTGNTIGGRYDTQYDTHTWNLANSDSQGWEMRSLSSFLSSPISAEHSTTTTEQDEALPQFTRQLPIPPAANPPSTNEGTQDLADTHAGAGLAKSKHKFKSKHPAAKVKCNPTMEPTPTITPMNTAKHQQTTGSLYKVVQGCTNSTLPQQCPSFTHLSQSITIHTNSHNADMLDSLDSLYNVDILDNLDNLCNADMLDMLDNVDMLYSSDNVDILV
ncbi:hypothetical protein DFH29DRAFT_1000707 [Suillus ampliporus]|nr:hypothetical protein DFH29DRAFT_1000707 [Suillus ampliporus]